MPPEDKDDEKVVTDISNQEQNDKEAPLIKPGYDYIWGSDQDDLVEGKEE